jgi:hypothetical protein
VPSCILLPDAMLKEPVREPATDEGRGHHDRGLDEGAEKYLPARRSPRSWAGSPAPDRPVGRWAVSEEVAGDLAGDLLGVVA